MQDASAAGVGTEAVRLAGRRAVSWSGLACALGALLLLQLVPTGATAGIIRAYPHPGLQSAIDQAAPGDTILVAQGRYQNHQLRQLNNGGQIYVLGYVDKFPLTIIGLAPELTWFGKTEYTDSIDGKNTHGIFAYGPPDGGTIRLEGLNIENNRFNMHMEVVTLQMRNCVVRRSLAGASLLLAGTLDSTIKDSQISDNDLGIWALAGGAGNRNLLIRGCTFARNLQAMAIAGAIGASIEECSFAEGRVGIVFERGGTGGLVGNQFSAIENVGVSVKNAWVQMEDNHIAGGGQAAVTVAFSGGLVTGTGNYFGGGSFATVYIADGSAAAHLTGGVILNSGGWSVSASTPEAGYEELDFRNNWWGTTDSTQIRDWIRDHDDNELLVRVASDPFLLQEPVATEKQSMGSLKALFRRP